MMTDTDNTGTRFSLLEIDLDEAPAKHPADMTPSELYDAMVKEGFPEPTQEPEAPVKAAQDPIDAFRIRMEEARSQRQAEEAVTRAQVRDQEVAKAGRIAEKASSYLAVAAADQTTGAVVYWQLSGDVDDADLARAWNDAGLDLGLLPNSPSPEVALNRAAKELQSRSVLIRQHPAGGWAIVKEFNDEGKLDYVVGPRVYLSKEGVIVVEPAKHQSQGEADLDACTVYEAFKKHQGLLSTTDISSALVNIASVLGAVGLRDRGGIYFVPKESIDTLHVMKTVFSVVTAHVIHEIPALKSDETVSAIVDALRREVQDAVVNVEGEINMDMGTRAAANRIKEMDALADKVSGYETLLGLELSDIQSHLSSLKAKLGNKSSWVTAIEL